MMKTFPTPNSVILFFIICNWQPAIASEIPASLFGINLGGVYQLDISDNVYINDNIPRQKFTGIKKSFGNGVHYYFKPKTLEKDFAYKEFTPAPGSPYFETTFSIYLLPVNDNALVKTHKNNQWQVIAIDWADSLDSQEAAYLWARRICHRYSNAIAVNAEITNYSDTQWYECRFATETQALNIGGMGSRVHISLAYSPEKIIELEKNASINNK